MSLLNNVLAGQSSLKIYHVMDFIKSYFYIKKWIIVSHFGPTSVQMPLFSQMQYLKATFYFFAIQIKDKSLNTKYLC